MMVTAFADAPLLNAGTTHRSRTLSLTRASTSCACLRVQRVKKDYLRQQLAFVNLVRDRMLADVHVLVTSLPSGGGGEQFSIELTGRVPGAADTTRRSDTVRVTLRADATGIEQREIIVRTIKLGLLPFMRGTASWERLDIVAVAEVARTQGTARGERDPWGGWVYRTNGSGYMDGDDNYASQQANLDLSASRIADGRKVVLTASGEYRRVRYTLEDARVVVAHQRNWSAQGLWVHSITDHMSAGALVSARSSLFGNTTLATRSAAAVEYNLLPYREATQRQAVMLYSLGVRTARYVDTTIFGRLRETRPVHALSITSEVRQRWGAVFLVGEASQYLHDRERFRIAFDGSFDWRIARGLTIGTFVSYAITRSAQYSRDETERRDRLLRLRELRPARSFNSTCRRRHLWVVVQQCGEPADAAILTQPRTAGHVCGLVPGAKPWRPGYFPEEGQLLTHPTPQCAVPVPLRSPRSPLCWRARVPHSPRSVRPTCAQVLLWPCTRPTARRPAMWRDGSGRTTACLDAASPRRESIWATRMDGGGPIACAPWHSAWA
jgi:hypothetical protein